MKLAVVVVAIMTIVVVPALTRNSQSQSQKRPNLAGVWIDSGEEVRISDDGNTVTAKYAVEKDCRYNDQSTPYKTGFEVKGTGLQLIGQGTICYYGKNGPGKNLPLGVHNDAPVNITVTPDGKKLQGVQVGIRGPIKFTLLRICKPDKNKLCSGLGQAAQAAHGFIASSTPPNASSYATLKQDLSSKLGDIRSELCDDPNAQQKIDEMMKTVESLNYASGKSNTAAYRALSAMELNLNALAASSCSGVPGGVCKSNEKKVEPGDEEAKNQVTGGIKAAIDQLKEAAEDLEGQGGAAAQKIETIKGQIKKYEEVMSLWDKIKAGSCVPKDVWQTLNQVANDHRANNHSENCPALCKASTDWFASIYAGSLSDVAKRFFMDTCLAHCN